MDRLKGKVAIVTGAGHEGNIGLAICEAYLREGAAGVVATDIRLDEADAIIGRLASVHGPDRFRLIRQDTTSPDDWDRVVAETKAEFGGIDVLVNNAGVSSWGGILDTSLETMRSVMAASTDARGRIS